MTRQEQEKYFKEKYGIDNIYDVAGEKDTTPILYEDLVYDGLDSDLAETNVEPFSPKPHTSVKISGKKPYNQ